MNATRLTEEEIDTIGGGHVTDGFAVVEDYDFARLKEQAKDALYLEDRAAAVHGILKTERQSHRTDIERLTAEIQWLRARAGTAETLLRAARVWVGADQRDLLGRISAWLESPPPR